MAESTRTVKVRMELEGGVTVRPGDTLIARVGQRTAAELAEAAAWRVEMQQLLPGVEVLVVHGVDQLLVYRPDDEPSGPTLGERLAANQATVLRQLDEEADGA